MRKTIDNFLNRFTMYRLTLWGLALLSVIAIVFGFFGILPYSGLSFVWALLISLAVCFATNVCISRMLRAPTGVESVWITAFILFLIMPPVSSWSDTGLVALAAVIAMASKYVLAIKKRHIFNPAAIGALLAGLVMGSGAIWWIGSVVMLPFVLVVGLLLVRKIRRMELFVVGTVAGILSAFATSVSSIGFLNANSSHLLFQIVASWPIVFFASIMLTEPATTPPTKKLQIIYGTIVGLLFGSSFHFGPLYMSPELALLIGNVFSYLVSSKQRIILHLKQKTQIAKDTFQFLF
ncbi:MAG: oxidoreductase, partial [Patescibacteria group bacterium]